MEYESSDDDEPIKQQRVGTEAMQRPQYQTPQFVKQIDKMTRDQLGEKQKMVRPKILVMYPFSACFPEVEQCTLFGSFR